DLIRIAKEITLGLIHLHDKNIIHRDLHSMNILINDGKALITDFGISKQLDAATTGPNSNTSVKGIPAYIEPQCFIYCEEKVAEINKKSDIYSLGVLFWELTSGIPPFMNFRNEIIIIRIARGDREKIVDNTPSSYANLFEKCWSTEPDQRPSLDQVLVELNKLSTENTVEFIINSINGGNEKILTKSNASVDSDSFTNDSIEAEVFSKTIPTAIIELTEKIISEEIKPKFISSDNENILAKSDATADSDSSISSSFETELTEEIIPEEFKTYDYKEFSNHRKIGEGGFGIVYQAKWESQELMVALKCPHVTIENTRMDLFEQV
ncbi:kinase-like domain-containing protein, partial [Gigaspora rosea]